jgi:hypothetical protein
MTALISDAFQTVIDYVEADNDGDMNQAVLDLIETLRDLREKAQDEEEGE